MKKKILSIAILAISIISCSSNEEEQDTIENAQEVVVTKTPNTKQPETKEKDNKIVEGQRSITSQNLERTFLLRVPNNYDSEKETPLVVALHGYTGSGKAMETNTKLTPLSEKEGFIVLYPDGIKDSRGFRNWAIQGNGKTTDGKDFDDVVFIDDIIELLKKELSIDPDRIYLSGFSNGGFMSYRIALLRSNVFAAVAPSGAYSLKTTADLNPERAIPVMHIHGSKDKIIPPTGVISPTSPYLYVQPSVNQWVDLNGASEMPTITQDNTNVIVKEYKSISENSADVIYVEVKKGEHQWFNKSNSGGFDSTALIWDFFKTHPRKTSTTQAIQ